MNKVLIAAVLAGLVFTGRAKAQDAPRIAPSEGEPTIHPDSTARVYFNPTANYVLGAWLSEIHFYDPGTRRDELGLYVNNVVLNGPAHRKGIERGDIIVRINGQRVTDLAEYKLALNASSGTVVIRLRNRRTGRYINVNDVRLDPVETPDPDNVP